MFYNKNKCPALPCPAPALPLPCLALPHVPKQTDPSFLET